jgi:hypothetical protein
MAFPLSLLMHMISLLLPAKKQNPKQEARYAHNHTVDAAFLKPFLRAAHLAELKTLRQFRRNGGDAFLGGGGQ